MQRFADAPAELREYVVRKITYRIEEFEPVGDGYRVVAKAGRPGQWSKVINRADLDAWFIEKTTMGL